MFMYATALINHPDGDFAVTEDSDVEILGDEFVMDDALFFHMFVNSEELVSVRKNEELVFFGIIRSSFLTLKCVEGDTFKVSTLDDEMLVFEVATSNVDDRSNYKTMYDRYQIAHTKSYDEIE